jgi:hypothetical protein
MFACRLHVRVPFACSRAVCMFACRLHVRVPFARSRAVCMFACRLHVRVPFACSRAVCMFACRLHVRVPFACSYKQIWGAVITQIQNDGFYHCPKVSDGVYETRETKRFR